MLRSCSVHWRTFRLLPACISSPTFTAFSTAFQLRLTFPAVSYGPRTSQLYHSTAVTSAAQPVSPATLPSDSNMAQSAIEMTSQSSRSYIVQEVLQQREVPPRYVYLAKAGSEKFILKKVSKSFYEDHEDLFRPLRGCPNIRLPCDTIPQQSALVYRYFSDHLLSLAQTDLPIQVIKRILKDALRGLAVLHDHDIVHTDIKPNNILIDRKQSDGTVERVQLADLEDSAHVPPNCDIVGKQAGNWMWRSPEAHASGPVNKPSDMFSFGVVCVYAIHKRIIFAVSEEELGDGEEILAHVLERQISYFADEEGLDALYKHLSDDNPWVQVLDILRAGFNKDNPRRPVSLWKDVDPELRNLVGGLTNFDPAKRLTAREALEHPWFKNVSISALSFS
ncbi:kinase-like domain-containing protein [Nemania serpens]|nr:kinase-like domain-containing protein [Nemania serpens]